MRSKLFKNNQKAVMAFFACNLLLVTNPIAALAAGEATVSPLNVQQQSSKITGTVTDAKGEPIIGASVRVKGSTKGSITDMDGKFVLDVPAGSQLEISYVGFEPMTVTATPGTPLNIVLKDNSETLNELVVVGYGVQKKSDVTGSVTSISKDRIGKIPVTNVLQAVQGAAAGVTITQTSSIPGDAPDAMVRGQNSINASSGPYIVVDGVPISKSGGTLNDINPNDIESMEILKDASATAIYGTNGSNGVILITTKRGKSGKPTIRYNGYVGFETFAHKLPFANGKEMTERYVEYQRQNGGTLYGPDKNLWNESEVAAYEAGTERDWIDEVSQTGIVQSHNVSIGGGAEHVKYYLSGDLMDQKGVIKGFNYKRYSFRMNLDADITDWLKVGTSSYIVSHNRDGGRANFTMAQAMSPYAQMYNEDGSYTFYSLSTERIFWNPLSSTTVSPERRQWNVNINGYAELNFGKMWKPLQGLTYKLNMGYAYMPKRYNDYQGAAQGNTNGGFAEIRNEDSQSYIIENIVTYARDFGKHHFDLTGLYSASRKKYQYADQTGTNFINDDQLWHNMGLAATQTARSYTELYTTVSQMGRLNYSYDSRYLFTVTVRRDGSSVFGANNKYGIFPSVALGWNITNESFMKKTGNWLNNLKLRLSYGKTGNEAIGVYQSMAKMDAGMMAFGGLSTPGIWLNSTMGNANLSWEKTKTFNVGIDFGLWNNRLSGNLDVYFARTNDLLLKRNLPRITGFDNYWSNMGETANKGIELTLNSRNIVTKDFTWSTSLVFSWNKNEIKDLYGDGKDDLGNRWFIGHPIGVVYDYEMVGIWQEDEIKAGLNKKWDPNAKAGDVKLADKNGDGDITSDDKVIKGQTSPKWIGGLTNTFTWKDLTLSVFVQTVQGITKNNNLIGAASDELGRRNYTTEIGYWTPENKSNEWRSLNKNSNPHGYGFAQNASYWRVKDITLSYNVPAPFLKKIGISGLTVYASGRNLFTFTDWIGWDPEARNVNRGNSSYDGTRAETVYDSSNYPMTKSYVFGINLTF